jgi:hypothetical protein
MLKLCQSRVKKRFVRLLEATKEAACANENATDPVAFQVHVEKV